MVNKSYNGHVSHLSITLNMNHERPVKYRPHRLLKEITATAYVSTYHVKTQQPTFFLLPSYKDHKVLMKTTRLDEAVVHFQPFV